MIKSYVVKLSVSGIFDLKFTEVELSWSARSFSAFLRIEKSRGLGHVALYEI